MDDVPDGFQEFGYMDPVMAGIAPVHYGLEPAGGLILGFRVAERHCNPRGICHGGIWATLADVLLGINVGRRTGLSGPTMSLTLDFLGPAIVGQWVEGRARLLRDTPRLAFVDCLFTADGEMALRASGVFRRKSALAPGFGGLPADD